MSEAESELVAAERKRFSPLQLFAAANAGKLQQLR